MSPRRIVASVDDLEEDESYETWCPGCMTKPDTHLTISIVRSKCVECREGYGD